MAEQNSKSKAPKAKAKAKAPKVPKAKAPKAKAPKVKAPKKAKPKTKAKKAVSKKAKPDQYFFLSDGKVIKDIQQLAKQMDELADEIFYHHVNHERHDFANWIKDVFEEAELAEQMLNAERNKEKNHYVILKYIVKGK